MKGNEKFKILLFSKLNFSKKYVFDKSLFNSKKKLMTNKDLDSQGVGSRAEAASKGCLAVAVIDETQIRWLVLISGGLNIIC